MIDGVVPLGMPGLSRQDSVLPEDWKFSFSQLQKYSGCGEQYYWAYVAEEKTPRYPAAWLVHGNALHAAVADWHLAREPRGELVDRYMTAWDVERETQERNCPDLALWSTTPRVKSVVTDLSNRQADGRHQAAMYEEEYNRGGWEIAQDDLGDPMVEIGFSQTLTLDGFDMVVRGHVDQVRIDEDGVLSIVDLKTGSPKGTDNRQLGLYGWGINRMFPDYEIQWGRMWYSKLDSVPRSGDKAGRYSAYTNLDSFDTAYWTSQFTQLYRGINNSVFLPNPGDNCRTCDALAFCSAKPSV